MSDKKRKFNTHDNSGNKKHKKGGTAPFRNWKKHTKIFNNTDKVKGVLITGEHMREGPMIGEILNTFKYFVDLFYPHLSNLPALPPTTEEDISHETHTVNAEKSSDIKDEATASAEAPAEAKKTPQKLFEVYNSGCSGMAIISFVPEELQPVEFVRRMLSHVVEGQEPKPKFTIEHTNRVVPLEATFEMVTLNSIIEAAKPILDLHFNDKPPTTFAIRPEERNNVNFDKMKCIDSLAPLIDSKHKVDLKNPGQVIMVQVFKSAAGISVLPDYNKLRKYNIKEVFKTLHPPPEPKEKEEKNTEKEEKSKEQV